MKKLFFTLALGLSLVSAFPQAMRTYNGTNELVAASHNPSSANTNAWVIDTNDFSYTQWTWWSDPSITNTSGPIYLESLRPGVSGRYVLVENLHWNRAPDLGGSNIVVVINNTNQGGLVGALTVPYLPRAIDTNRLADSFLYWTPNGTGTDTNFFFGPTNIFFRLGRDFYLTNNGTATTLYVRNNGGGAIVYAQGSSAATFGVAGTANTVNLNDGTDVAQLFNHEWHPTTDTALSLGNPQGLRWKNLALSGTNYIVSYKDATTTNYVRLESSMNGDTSIINLTSKTNGVDGPITGYSFRTNGVEVFNVTGTGGPSSGANWTAVGTTDSSLAGTASVGTDLKVVRTALIGVSQNTNSTILSGKLPVPFVCFVIEDTIASGYSVYKPILDAAGVVGCEVVVTGLIDSGPSYITTAQALSMQTAGWEIINGTKTHPDLTAVTLAQAEDEINGAKTLLESAGFVITDFSWPGCNKNDNVRTIMRQRHRGGMGCSPAVNGHPFQEDYLGAIKITAANLATCESFVDTAFTDNKLAVFYIEDATVAANLTALVAYVQAKPITIGTMRQGLIACGNDLNTRSFRIGQDGVSKTDKKLWLVKSAFDTTPGASTVSSTNTYLQIGGGEYGNGVPYCITFGYMPENSAYPYMPAYMGYIDAGGGDMGRLSFGTRPTTSTGNPPLERMIVAPDGNVGIATNAPSEKLEVAGNIKASGVTKIRGFQDGYTNVLVSTTGKDFFYVSVPNTNGIGGHVVYTVFGTDGTDVQEISGDVKFASVAKGTTVTATVADVQSPAALTGGSTLTAVLAANTTTNNVFALGVTATTSLTTTNLVIKWRVETPSTFTVNAIP